MPVPPPRSEATRRREGREPAGVLRLQRLPGRGRAADGRREGRRRLQRGERVLRPVDVCRAERGLPDGGGRRNGVHRRRRLHPDGNADGPVRGVSAGALRVRAGRGGDLGVRRRRRAAVHRPRVVARGVRAGEPGADDLLLPQHAPLFQDAPELVPDQLRATACARRGTSTPFAERRHSRASSRTRPSPTWADGFFGFVAAAGFFGFWPSRAMLHSSSARLFCSRRTCVTVTAANPRHQLLRLLEERLQVLVLDPVLAGDLLDQQFAVAVDLQAPQAHPLRLFQGLDQGGVLGDVVRLLAEDAGLLDDRPPGRAMTTA